MPLATSFNHVNLVLDVEVANSRTGPWFMKSKMPEHMRKLAPNCITCRPYLSL
ncbi:hypothetical protein [Pseudomonas frederiksbergensis]|uniref:hypothetical protein n=1 Tax=Pseudomonas frederiksbergensis TaxID=104087 RepID=UPI0013747C09|nr:hypothetical protein [Pseudomonas frederiksbergensis]